MKLANPEKTSVTPLARGAATAPAPNSSLVTHHSSLQLEHLRSVVYAALDAVENATQLCLAAGQLLNEKRETLDHGEFKPFIEKYLPRISYDTANRWSRAAANVEKRLQPPAIDIPVSVILNTPAADLPAEAKKYRQAWLDFTADKTIKNCLDDVCVAGDPGHRVDRALNGKLKGGTNLHDNRKDFPLFTAQALVKLSGHLSHFAKLNKVSQSEIEQLLRSAILGTPTTLAGGAATRVSRTFPYKHPWPEPLVKLLLSICKQRLKGGASDE